MKASLAILSRFDFIGILLLRIGAGAAIAYQGFTFLPEGPEKWEAIGHAAGLIGIIDVYHSHMILGLVSIILASCGGLAIVLGLLTRGLSLTLGIISGFAVATLIQQGNDILEIILALQLALSLLAIAFIGPGRLSLDRKGI
tara:strand:+ start:298 stop:723 length:426 start_codon:yes stop_codon:yes gene_type:complete